jgi:hypothetical protein
VIKPYGAEKLFEALGRVTGIAPSI